MLMDTNGNTKKVLIKDLSSRLPYGVKASYYGADEECETQDEIEGITLDEDFGGYVEIGQYSLPIERVKPYLFPLLSMTEEQQIDLTKFVANGIHGENILYDWYNKSHFDYRGLIEKSLALDATNLGIYEQYDRRITQNFIRK